MPPVLLRAAVEGFEDSTTADEVFQIAQAVCDRCACTSGRCTGYGRCPMMARLDLKMDAIDAEGVFA